jgi:hypothetical protein
MDGSCDSSWDRDVTMTLCNITYTTVVNCGIHVFRTNNDTTLDSCALLWVTERTIHRRRHYRFIIDANGHPSLNRSFAHSRSLCIQSFPLPSIFSGPISSSAYPSGRYFKPSSPGTGLLKSRDAQLDGPKRFHSVGLT